MCREDICVFVCGFFCVFGVRRVVGVEEKFVVFVRRRCEYGFVMFFMF